MKKGLLIVGALVILGALVSGAFAGGLVVGRLSGRAAQAPIVATCEVPQGGEATELPTPEPLQGPEVGDEASPTPVPPTADSPEVEDGAADGVAPVEAFDYELLRTVLELLDEQFYGEIPDGDELAFGAVRGLLMTPIPHSYPRISRRSSTRMPPASSRVSARWYRCVRMATSRSPA